MRRGSAPRVPAFFFKINTKQLRDMIMRKKAIFLFVFLFVMAGAVSSYAANISAQIEGYYGGTLTVSGHYEVINPNPASFDPDMNSTVTYQYNSFSIIPSVSLQGTITDSGSDETEMETITGNFTVLVGGISYNVECYCQYDEDNDIFSPGSHITINGVFYPASWDLLDIIEQLGMIF